MSMVKAAWERERKVKFLLYVKPSNEVLALHIHATRSQQAGVSLDECLQVLKTLSEDCDCKAVTDEQDRDEAIRDALTAGLQSSDIHQRLLENKTLDLAMMFDQARALESTQKSSGS